ncbi:unnamed protein product [Musa acuminata subsp. malaccensis]|uniref:(wild Malaysian banana) hypothetical protein n=1 Tax=Musa acuminata subsp. malaccensis TaxID=214687 RepID=A0A804L5H5_MUSAM|nr:unnamed protein product [Musa acuminata subsp. malaccensis]
MFLLSSPYPHFQVLGFLWPLMSYIWTCQERSFFGLHSLLQLAKRKIEEKQSKGCTSLSIHHNWESLQACSETEPAMSNAISTLIE